MWSFPVIYPKHYVAEDFLVLPYLSRCFLSLRCRIILNIYKLNMGTPIICSFNFNQWWVSVMVSICYKKKPFWWWMRAILLSGYKDKDSEYSLELHCLRKESVVRFPLGSVTLSDMGRWLHYSTIYEFPFIEWTLSPVRRLFIMPPNVSGIIAPLHISWHAVHCWGS